MTAAAGAPVRHRPPRAAGAVPLTAARLLRIELRGNAMPWILPLIAVLFWFDSYRPSTAQSPIWMLRTFWNMGQGHTIVDFGPFVVGVAAWMGSRDGRRGTADLVTATARPRWAAQLATWAATATWAVGAYLVFVGVLFGVYAYQGVQGSPPSWWVAVGAAAVTAFSAAGFAVGAFFPSRFAAPLAAFGGFLVMMMSSQTGFRDTSGWPLILPTNSNSNYQPASGIFYPYLPDLPIARMMFLAGIAVVALGLLGLPARAGGPWLRRAAAVVTLAGVAAAGTAAGLADAARLGPHGMVIPALHDAANDRPIPYTAVCGHAAGVPVCLNPAYRGYLPDVTAALRPVLGEVAGLPGAPARATHVGAQRAEASARAGLCRCPAVRRAAGRCPARLARVPPGRAAGRPAAPGTAAMTAAGVHSSPPGAAPAPAEARPSTAGVRLAWLYLVSRRAPAALGLLAGLGGLLWAALHWHWNIAGGPAAQELMPLVIETGAAAVIAVTTYGPLGEPERATGRWLPYLRLGAALLLTAAAAAALAAGATGGYLPGGTLAMLRNLAGMTGTGLLSAAALGGAFGWTGPMAYLLVTETALAADWTTPWIWPARPPHDLGGALCACGVFASGIAAVTLLGARDSSRRSAPG